MSRGRARWMQHLVLIALLVLAAPARPVRAADEPGLNPITQVQPGMTMLEVLRTLGPPSDIVGHTFYYARKGKVVFASGGSPLDKTKVEKIEPDPIQERVP